MHRGEGAALNQSVCSRRVWLAFLAPLVVACAENGSDDTACANRLQAPLINASDQERYLGLDMGQLAALVTVTDGSNAGGALCTGIFVTNEWLVTGAHCFQIESPVVMGAPSEGAVALPVVERIAHPSLDVALFRVSGSTGQELQPIPVATTSELAVSIGSVVELAGYGLTEAGDIRQLRFLAEPIVEIDQDSFVVDGFGANGACLGDSGGPLLVRAPAGPVRVAGILTAGAASCVDRDRYLRLDPLSEWVSEIAGSSAARNEPCGGISEEGRCLYGSALFCDEGKLVGEPCAEAAGCGWDRQERGFRCIEAKVNPCAGVDSIGACIDGVPRRCNAGMLEGETCACGAVCRVDGKTGGPACRKPAAAMP
jgi:hypothetical protein